MACDIVKQSQQRTPTVGGRSEEAKNKSISERRDDCTLAERQVSGAIIAHWLSIGVWVSV